MKQILVIEDDQPHLKMLKALLSKADFSVLMASNGVEGCDLYYKNPCDLVICDIFMPEKEGLETITDIKDYHPEAKIIAISGGGSKNFFARKDILRMARDLGADIIMPKPINVPKLMQSIQQLLPT